jgi:hypothetical protein
MDREEILVDERPNKPKSGLEQIALDVVGKYT